MNPRRLLAVAAAVAVLVPAAALAQIHCSELPPLEHDTVFPRCGRNELLIAGFPDHMHAYAWSGWQVPRDDAGHEYGPGSLCMGRVPREGVTRVVDEGDALRLGHFVIHHDPRVPFCGVAPFLEHMEWAERYVADVLGLTVQDTLSIVDPVDVASYQETSGQGTWRLFKRDGDDVILQPYRTLAARTLDQHAAVMLMTDWALAENLPQPLPRWLQRGLVEYVAEDGAHLANYMAEFRPKGNVLLSPPLIEAIEAQGVDADQGRDRELHRRAGYSAFLMVWELVENQGGLEALRDFLHQAAEGIDLDQAAVKVYGLDLQGLAGLLDAAKLGEPYGKPVGRHTPHIQP